jgi:type III secretory pathway lipoprotein EscJ
MAEAQAAPPSVGRKGNNRLVPLLLGVIVLIAGAVVFLMYRPNLAQLGQRKVPGGYSVLFQNLELAESAKIVDSILKHGVKNYRLEDDGRTILVPQKKKTDLALAIAKEGIMPSGGQVGFEIFDKGSQLGATDFDKQIKFTRAISGELSRSISRIYGVEEAKVQVVVPAKELFQTVKNPVIASVFVKVKEGFYLSPDQVSGIVSLVASSVEDMKKKNVTVVDYYGRILSSKEYVKDYDKLRMGSTLNKTKKIASTEDTVQTKGALPTSFFDVYQKKDQQRRDRQERSIMGSVGLRGGMDTEEELTAKLKFKAKYEKMIEENILAIGEQFFPKNSVRVKVNVELNNLKNIETGNPNTLISRITTLMLLDENNKDIILTPEIREALMKSVASIVGYVRGRDRIDLRWAPMFSTYNKGSSLTTVFGKDKPAVETIKEDNKEGGATFGKEAVPSWLKPKGTVQHKKQGVFSLGWIKALVSQQYLFYGAGLLISGALLVWGFRRRGTGTKPDQNVFSPQDAEKDFSDLQNAAVDQVRDIATKSPERIAAVLEQWFQEDEQK